MNAVTPDPAAKRLVADTRRLHVLRQSHPTRATFAEEPYVPSRHLARQDGCASCGLSETDGARQNVSMAAQRHFIREWRKYRGLTQLAMAERIGISRPHLSKIEKGTRQYDQQFLEAAAVVLCCETPDLIIRNPLDPEGIWSVWDRLEPVNRIQLVEMGKVLLKTGTGG